MEGTVRYIFSGGNTPKGFYSYYNYILPQEKAQYKAHSFSKFVQYSRQGNIIFTLLRAQVMANAIQLHWQNRQSPKTAQLLYSHAVETAHFLKW